MIYFTSDHHFSHANIIRFCDRPFEDVHTMNKILTDNWNSVVSPDDTVYHLGDFSFGGKISKFLQYLNGNIILIRGNHDRNSNIKGCGLTIHQNLDFEYDGYKFKLNHRPVFTADAVDKDSERRSIIDLDEYDYILCGHIHEKWLQNQKNINVGVDVWDFKPVSIETIIELIKSNKI